MKILLTVPRLPMAKRIDAYLAGAFQGQFSRQEVKAALQKSDILLNGRPVRPSASVREGDRIEGHLVSSKKTAMVPESLPVHVIYEDDCLLVVDKPAGMVVHPGAGNRKGTLAHALLGRGRALSTRGGADRPGIVHRLDKDTSGLLVVAKDNRTHRFLQSQFESRTFSKIYRALVRGRVDFEEGHMDAPLARHPKIKQRMAVSHDAAAKEAHTRYRVLERFPHATLLEIRILTGRTHQIRVHMAHLGHPVIGDRVYGRAEKAGRLALHALKIAFLHPQTDKRVEFESAPPEDFEALIKNEEEKR